MRALSRKLGARLIRAGIRRGLVDGNRRWLVVGAVGVVLRAVLKSEPPLVREETLRPGETLVVTNPPKRPRGSGRRRGGVA